MSQANSSTSSREASHRDMDKTPYDVQSGPVADLALPTGWKYRKHRFGPIKIPYYGSPMAQLILIAFVCFLCPGMFNALNGMGGGGQFDAQTSDIANACVYGMFAVTAFFSGSVINRIGNRWACSLGGIGYMIYVAAYLSYNHNQNLGFVVFAGLFLGFCAGLLWTAQGAIMMAYPKEYSKGRYIMVFWIIFNFGSVLGGLIPLGTNLHRATAASVTDGTYIGFIVVTFCGALLACGVANAKDIYRTDGTSVMTMRHPTWKTELKGLAECLKTDWYIIALFPMFWASNYFYTYQFNAVNSNYFTVRTRSLNSILYWLAQMVGATVFGLAFDAPQFSRPLKAKISWFALLALTLAIWGGGYDFQKGFTRESTMESEGFKAMDWTTAGYAGPAFLYIFYGFFDSVWQTCVYWYMGALTNNARKLANFAGFYKGIQSAGAAVAFGTDAAKVPYMNEFFATWGILLFGLLCGATLIFTKIQPDVNIEADAKFTDAADVYVTQEMNAREPDHHGRTSSARPEHELSDVGRSHV